MGKPGALQPPHCTMSSFTAWRSSASVTADGRFPTYTRLAGRAASGLNSW